MTQFTQIPTIEKDTVIVSYFSRKRDKNSTDLLGKFIASYLEHPAGWTHKLFFIKKGYEHDEARWRKALEPLDGLDYGVLEVPDRHYCFGYQKLLLEHWPEQYTLFLTAQTRFLVDNWLDLYMRHAASNRLLGNHGSYQSMVNGWYRIEKRWVRNYLSPMSWLRYFLFLDKGKIAINRSLYEFFLLFPSLHLRTNAFMVPPHILDTIAWPNAEDIQGKYDEYYFENGKFNLSVQALLAGMELYVVGADGNKYAIENWRDAETFYYKKQKNAIVGDHLTRLFEAAPFIKRRILTFDSWGRNGKTDVDRVLRKARPLDLESYRRCRGCRQREFLEHFHTTNNPDNKLSDQKFSYSLCGFCGTISIDKVPDDLDSCRADTAKISASCLGKEIAQETIDLVQKHGPSGRTFLEVVRGAGCVAEEMAQNGYQVSCLTITTSQEDSDQQPQGFEVLRTSNPAETLARLDRRWDIIFAHHALEHLDNPVDTINECAEHLSPNGLLIVTLPNIWSLAFRLFRGAVRTTLNAPLHLTLITEQTCVQAADGVGLRLVEKINQNATARKADDEVWTHIGEYLDKTNRQNLSPCVRLVHGACRFFYRIMLLDNKTGEARAVDATGRLFRNLEQRLGKSNAFTLVFQKEEDRV